MCCIELNAQDAIETQSFPSADTEIDWVAYMQEVEGFLDVSLHSLVPSYSSGMLSGA